ncbi:MAG: DUF5715 family protein, partial [Longimicrobiales bacterium]|nr:DUF5715 family protein [Longimicrobiales bacterium]
MELRSFTGVLLVLVFTASPGVAQSLEGSLAAMNRQRTAAVAAGATFHETASSVYGAIVQGELVRVESTTDYRLHAVSYPYARAETLALLEHLAAGYHSACGQRLVVTSLTRSRADQPRNASRRSVHPAGLAIDLRRSSRYSCRRWLERTLLRLEGEGLVEATRERWPPHYHVAVLPRAVRDRWSERVAAAEAVAPLADTTYEVRSGDTLWEIARDLES